MPKRKTPPWRPEAGQEDAISGEDPRDTRSHHRGQRSPVRRGRVLAVQKTEKRKNADDTPKVFVVKLTISKTVKVRVPGRVVGKCASYKTAIEAATEFAVSSKRFSPEYVISEDEDYKVKSVREVK